MCVFFATLYVETAFLGWFVYEVDEAQPAVIWAVTHPFFLASPPKAQLISRKRNRPYRIDMGRDGTRRYGCGFCENPPVGKPGGLEKTRP